MSDLRWPVIITDTREHVVWMHGDTEDDALRNAEHFELYELVAEHNLAECFMSIRKPDAWDQRLVTEDGGGGYLGTECTEPAEAIRRHIYDAKQAACAEAGHPDHQSHS